MKINKSLNELAANLLAWALIKNYNAELANISVSDEGFNIDIKTPEGVTISSNDFLKIEKAVMKIATGAYPISINGMANAKLTQTLNNKFAKLLMQKTYSNSDILSFSDYTYFATEIKDKSTNVVKFFKLLSIGGIIWTNNDEQQQLVRLTGFATSTKQEQDDYLVEYNERIERDHRTIGKNLEIFTFNNLTGQGMPIWLPNGSIIKKEIRNFLGELEFKYGFQSTYSPILGNIDLYKQSGHWDHYQENMFPPIKIDHEELVLRPMTCPHHIMIFKRKPYSYKQLPVRLCEESMLHRYESSGGLTGLERVREMVLEDTHIFCTIDQLEHEVLNCYNIINDAYKGIGCKIHEVDLSLHDPLDKIKYHHDEQMWISAEEKLRTVLVKNKIDYVEKVGEAAFYGPKIDLQVQTSLGRIITMSTIQLDFLLPEKFDLSYKDKDGNAQPIVMIHLGIVGTYERLVSIILEQTKGILPLWLAPIQVVIIPINNEHHEKYAQQVFDYLRKQMIRVEVDNRDERLSKKIREAQMSKVCYQIIIGDEEVKNNNIAYREYGSEDSHEETLERFSKHIKQIIADKKIN